MNVYDTVNRLASEIKESEEYLNFKKAKQVINSEQNYKEKIAKFEKLRYEEQMNAIQNGKPDENKMNEIQNLYKEMISDAVQDVIS